ncbi:helix-turn-helix transcriptional regulator [Streptomyces sp. NPDC091279]|uniref:helix-turn-helix transcriptional regulator n=1 Tax=unclassified Streptomyces TaxID=2593676 RepID=UPI0038056DEC
MPAQRTGELPHQESPFRAAYPILHTTELGSVTAYRIEFRTPDCGPRVLAADPGRHALVLSARGAIGVVRDGRAFVVRDETVALCDTRLPLSIGPGTGEQAAEAVVMVFPDTAVPTLLPYPDEPPHQVRDATGPGSLLRWFLVEAAVRAPGLRAPEAARFGDAALHLAAAVLERRFVDTAQACPQTQQHELMTRIRGFVDRNLGDPDLTPGLVATAHHISIRHLQRLFKDEGSTPSDWIRQRRLETCRRELRDPELRALPIREIGLRNGFTQASDFSRVFRARYGMPPGRFRDGRRHPDATG